MLTQDIFTVLILAHFHTNSVSALDSMKLMNTYKI